MNKTCISAIPKRRAKGKIYPDLIKNLKVADRKAAAPKQAGFDYFGGDD